jgi:glycosyltransferase involved in cell wall biosynthesis
MRIAVIRGKNLNKWEIQNYEPLIGRHQITAYTTREHKFSLDEIKVSVRILPSIKGFPEGMDGLVEELEGFDLAYTLDTLYGYSYQAIQAKERYGIKVAVCCTENIPFNYEENPMNRGLSSYANRKAIREKVREGADLFIALTNRARDALLVEGVLDEKIEVIPWGIDTDLFRPTTKRSPALMEMLDIKEDEFVILYNGRYDWHRGVYDLIYAAKGLLDDQELKDFSIKFLFIGSGAEIEGMRWLASKLKIEENVVIFDNHPHRFGYEELPEIYNLANIFCFPSVPTRFIKEQFGMVLLEAMGCGVPVITTICGSIPEVIGDAGIMVQPNDPQDLKGAIKDLILDGAKRERLSLEGQRRVKGLFSSFKVAQRVEAAFMERFNL